MRGFLSKIGMSPGSGSGQQQQQSEPQSESQQQEDNAEGSEFSDEGEFSSSPAHSVEDAQGRGGSELQQQHQQIIAEIKALHIAGTQMEVLYEMFPPHLVDQVVNDSRGDEGSHSYSGSRSHDSGSYSGSRSYYSDDDQERSDYSGSNRSYGESRGSGKSYDSRYNKNSGDDSGSYDSRGSYSSTSSSRGSRGSSSHCSRSKSPDLMSEQSEHAGWPVSSPESEERKQLDRQQQLDSWQEQDQSADEPSINSHEHQHRQDGNRLSSSTVAAFPSHPKPSSKKDQGDESEDDSISLSDIISHEESSSNNSRSRDSNNRSVSVGDSSNSRSKSRSGGSYDSKSYNGSYDDDSHDSQSPSAVGSSRSYFSDAENNDNDTRSYYSDDDDDDDDDVHSGSGTANHHHSDDNSKSHSFPQRSAATEEEIDDDQEQQEDILRLVHLGTNPAVLENMFSPDLVKATLQRQKTQQQQQADEEETVPPESNSPSQAVSMASLDADAAPNLQPRVHFEPADKNEKVAIECNSENYDDIDDNDDESDDDNAFNKKSPKSLSRPRSGSSLGDSDQDDASGRSQSGYTDKHKSNNTSNEESFPVNTSHGLISSGITLKQQQQSRHIYEPYNESHSEATTNMDSFAGEASDHIPSGSSAPTKPQSRHVYEPHHESHSEATTNMDSFAREASEHTPLATTLPSTLTQQSRQGEEPNNESHSDATSNMDSFAVESSYGFNSSVSTGNDTGQQQRSSVSSEGFLAPSCQTPSSSTQVESFALPSDHPVSLHKLPYLPARGDGDDDSLEEGKETSLRERSYKNDESEERSWTENDSIAQSFAMDSNHPIIERDSSISENQNQDSQQTSEGSEVVPEEMTSEYESESSSEALSIESTTKHKETPSQASIDSSQYESENLSIQSATQREEFVSRSSVKNSDHGSEILSSSYETSQEASFAMETDHVSSPILPLEGNLSGEVSPDHKNESISFKNESEDGVEKDDGSRSRSDQSHSSFVSGFESSTSRRSHGDDVGSSSVQSECEYGSVNEDMASFSDRPDRSGQDSDGAGGSSADQDEHASTEQVSVQGGINSYQKEAHAELQSALKISKSSDRSIENSKGNLSNSSRFSDRSISKIPTFGGSVKRQGSVSNGSIERRDPAAAGWSPADYSGSFSHRSGSDNQTDEVNSRSSSNTSRSRTVSGEGSRRQGSIDSSIDRQADSAWTGNEDEAQSAHSGQSSVDSFVQELWNGKHDDIPNTSGSVGSAGSPDRNVAMRKLSSETQKSKESNFIAIRQLMDVGTDQSVLESMFSSEEVAHCVAKASATEDGGSSIRRGDEDLIVKGSVSAKSSTRKLSARPTEITHGKEYVPGGEVNLNDGSGESAGYDNNEVFDKRIGNRSENERQDNSSSYYNSESNASDGDSYYSASSGSSSSELDKFRPDIERLLSVGTDMAKLEDMYSSDLVARVIALQDKGSGSIGSFHSSCASSGNDAIETGTKNDEISCEQDATNSSRQDDTLGKGLINDAAKSKISAAAFSGKEHFESGASTLPHRRRFSFPKSGVLPAKLENSNSSGESNADDVTFTSQQLDDKVAAIHTLLAAGTDQGIVEIIFGAKTVSKAIMSFSSGALPANDDSKAMKDASEGFSDYDPGQNSDQTNDEDTGFHNDSFRAIDAAKNHEADKGFGAWPGQDLHLNAGDVAAIKNLHEAGVERSVLVSMFSEADVTKVLGTESSKASNCFSFSFGSSKSDESLKSSTGSGTRESRPTSISSQEISGFNECVKSSSQKFENMSDKAHCEYSEPGPFISSPADHERSASSRCSSDVNSEHSSDEQHDNNDGGSDFRVKQLLDSGMDSFITATKSEELESSEDKTILQTQNTLEAADITRNDDLSSDYGSTGAESFNQQSTNPQEDNNVEAPSHSSYSQQLSPLVEQPKRSREIDQSNAFNSGGSTTSDQSFHRVDEQGLMNETNKTALSRNEKLDEDIMYWLGNGTSLDIVETMYSPKDVARVMSLMKQQEIVQDGKKITPKKLKKTKKQPNKAQASFGDLSTCSENKEATQGCKPKRKSKIKKTRNSFSSSENSAARMPEVLIAFADSSSVSAERERQKDSSSSSINLLDKSAALGSVSERDIGPGKGDAKVKKESSWTSSDRNVKSAETEKKNVQDSNGTRIVGVEEEPRNSSWSSSSKKPGAEMVKAAKKSSNASSLAMSKSQERSFRPSNSKEPNSLDVSGNVEINESTSCALPASNKREFIPSVPSRTARGRISTAKQGPSSSEWSVTKTTNEAEAKDSSWSSSNASQNCTGKEDFPRFSSDIRSGKVLGKEKNMNGSSVVLSTVSHPHKVRNGRTQRSTSPQRRPRHQLDGSRRQRKMSKNTSVETLLAEIIDLKEENMKLQKTRSGSYAFHNESSRKDLSRLRLDEKDAQFLMKENRILMQRLSKLEIEYERQSQQFEMTIGQLGIVSLEKQDLKKELELLLCTPKGKRAWVYRKSVDSKLASYQKKVQEGKQAIQKLTAKTTSYAESLGLTTEQGADIRKELLFSQKKMEIIKAENQALAVSLDKSLEQQEKLQESLLNAAKDWNERKHRIYQEIGDNLEEKYAGQFFEYDESLREAAAQVEALTLERDGLLMEVARLQEVAMDRKKLLLDVNDKLRHASVENLEATTKYEKSHKKCAMLTAVVEALQHSLSEKERELSLLNYKTSALQDDLTSAYEEVWLAEQERNELAEKSRDLDIRTGKYEMTLADVCHQLDVAMEKNATLERHLMDSIHDCDALRAAKTMAESSLQTTEANIQSFHDLLNETKEEMKYLSAENRALVEQELYRYADPGKSFATDRYQ